MFSDYIGLSLQRDIFVFEKILIKQSTRFSQQIREIPRLRFNVCFTILIHKVSSRIFSLGRSEGLALTELTVITLISLNWRKRQCKRRKQVNCVPEVKPTLTFRRRNKFTLFAVMHFPG